MSERLLPKEPEAVQPKTASSIEHKTAFSGAFGERLRAAAEITQEMLETGEMPEKIREIMLLGKEISGWIDNQGTFVVVCGNFKECPPRRISDEDMELLRTICKNLLKVYRSTEPTNPDRTALENAIAEIYYKIERMGGKEEVDFFSEHYVAHMKNSEGRLGRFCLRGLGNLSGPDACAMLAYAASNGGEEFRKVAASYLKDAGLNDQDDMNCGGDGPPAALHPDAKQILFDAVKSTYPDQFTENAPRNRRKEYAYLHDQYFRSAEPPMEMISKLPGGNGMALG